MTKTNRTVSILVVAAVAAALLLLLAGTALAMPTNGRVVVGPGQTYEVNKITKLNYLKITEGGIVKAKSGYSLTMTINGVETGGTIYSWPTGVFDPPPPFAPPGTPDMERYAGEVRIKPGVYRGNIVLTPTKEMLMPRGAPFPAGNEPYLWPYRTALYIDGGVVADKSVMAAVKGGPVKSTYAKNLRITSTGDYFNGVMVMGNSKYTLWGPRLSFTGNGHDDFGGFGAAVRVAGTSDVTIDKGRIVTDGVVRSAVWVGDNAKVTVNDSSIQTGLGVLPADWLGGPFPPGTGGSMLTVPWMLGISGNCRATSVVSTGDAYYNNCFIQAQQWGALSTDMCFGASLTVTNSKIKVIESGYGAYADMQVDDTFIHCTFDVPDYGVIHTGPGTTTFTKATVVNSKRWGVMFHGGAPGTVVVDKGSAFNTGLTTFLLKNSYPTFEIDSAKLSPANGIILHAMLSDDPMSPDQSGGDTDVDADFSNMAMQGDIVNTNTTKCNVNVTLTKASITGAISTGTQEFLGVYPRTPEDRDDIGMVKATYAPTADAFGVKVVINDGGMWVVTETSYLTSLQVNTGGVLEGDVTVNGVPTTLVPGTVYTGAIVVTAD
jgi:hypothetical protein